MKTIFSEKQEFESLENSLNGNIIGSTIPENLHVSHLEVEIPFGTSIDGKKIRDLNFPEDCVIVKIIRDGDIVLPRGNILLKVGDRLEIFGTKENLNNAKKLLIN